MSIENVSFLLSQARQFRSLRSVRASHTGINSSFNGSIDPQYSLVLGVYKAEIVVVKRIFKDAEVTLSKEDLMEMKLVSE